MQNGQVAEALLNDIAACKAACTCPALRLRAQYFEPNPRTLDQWQAGGRYLHLDRRVVFVCESPGPRCAADGPFRGWSIGRHDARFLEARLRYGFADCYLTNVVKCGVRTGRQHTPEELAACRRFLLRELAWINPRVAVGVGGNAYRGLVQALAEMANAPIPFRITHYSARGRVWGKWRLEFAELQRLAGN
jgi:uracil-DNA glycosylase family 4